jgi:diadenosine tetraphosphatase ApaH/serine/threonine PP2A family protein phosphatase
VVADEDGVHVVRAGDLSSLHQLPEPVQVHARLPTVRPDHIGEATAPAEAIPAGKVPDRLRSQRERNAVLG